MKHWTLLTITIFMLLWFPVGINNVNTKGNCAAGDRITNHEVWSYTYGGSSNDHIRAMQITNNGDYIILGITNSFGATSPNWWILRLDSYGKVIWEKSVDWAEFDRTWSIIETSDGGFIASGSSSGLNGEDAIIIKLSGTGDMVWQTTFSSQSGEDRFFTSIAETQDGGYILAGQINYGGEETWIAKLNSAGAVLWEKYHTSAEIFRVIEISGGNLLIAGRSSAGAGSYDLWAEKLTADGIPIWQKTYGELFAEYLGDILETSDNHYILTGYTESFGVGNYDGWVIKLDVDGNIAWQKAYGGINNDYLFTLDETMAGDLLVAGYSQSFGQGDQDYWLMKLTPSGDIIWQKNYGGSANDAVFAMQATTDGGIIVGGETYSFGAGKWDIWIMKLDSEGDLGQCGLGFDGLADIQNTSAKVSDTAFPFQDISSQITTREFVIQDTSAISIWICPLYMRYLPTIHK